MKKLRPRMLKIGVAMFMVGCCVNDFEAKYVLLYVAWMLTSIMLIGTGAVK